MYNDFMNTTIGLIYSVATASLISNVDLVQYKVSSLFMRDSFASATALVRPANDVYSALASKANADRLYWKKQWDKDHNKSSRTYAFISQNNGPAYCWKDQQIGYIAPSAPGNVNKLLDVIDASNIEPDSRLLGLPLKITLDDLHVYDYPGRGPSSRTVLFRFDAQHTPTLQPTESVTFTLQNEARIGGSMAVTGVPVFKGLVLKDDGLIFNIEVKQLQIQDNVNKLQFLKSTEFQSGLSLLSTSNPAIAVLSKYAVNVAEKYLTKDDNRIVQHHYAGLDCSNIPSRPKLAYGTYVLACVPDRHYINWEEWQYDTSQGYGLRNKKDPKAVLPCNYIIVSISRVQ